MSNIGFNYWATTAAISGGVCAMSITTQWPLRYSKWDCLRWNCVARCPSGHFRAY
jgi:hypothetical protein